MRIHHRYIWRTREGQTIAGPFCYYTCTCGARIITQGPRGVYFRNADDKKGRPVKSVTGYLSEAIQKATSKALPDSKYAPALGSAATGYLLSHIKGHTTEAAQCFLMAILEAIKAAIPPEEMEKLLEEQRRRKTK